MFYQHKQINDIIQIRTEELLGKIANMSHNGSPSLLKQVSEGEWDIIKPLNVTLYFELLTLRFINSRILKRRLEESMSC